MLSPKKKEQLNLRLVSSLPAAIQIRRIVVVAITATPSSITTQATSYLHELQIGGDSFRILAEIAILHTGRLLVAEIESDTFVATPAMI